MPLSHQGTTKPTLRRPSLPLWGLRVLLYLLREGPLVPQAPCTAGPSRAGVPHRQYVTSHCICRCSGDRQPRLARGMPRWVGAGKEGLHGGCDRQRQGGDRPGGEGSCRPAGPWDGTLGLEQLGPAGAEGERPTPALEAGPGSLEQGSVTVRGRQVDPSPRLVRWDQHMRSPDSRSKSHSMRMGYVWESLSQR